MSGKIEFGFDYLVLVRNLQWQGRNPSDGLDPVDDAAARLFLLQWGFTLKEIDEVNNVFWDRARTSSLPTDLLAVAKRIADHVNENKDAKERLVVELAAIGAMDGNVSPDEGRFVYNFRDLLDMRPSEFDALINQGTGWAIGLNFFGQEFAKARGARSPYHILPI